MCIHNLRTVDIVHILPNLSTHDYESCTLMLPKALVSIVPSHHFTSGSTCQLPYGPANSTQKAVPVPELPTLTSRIPRYWVLWKVCKAILDQLPCAAKLLHPVLFQFNDPGSQAIVRRFEQECEFLSEIRHPHVVQYLGVARDPESGLPVLLMELMDEPLTGFLERSNKPLPNHLQVNLCHDIVLGLAYLHLNGIIHRDLSSNNVLLIAGSRAKVTDFGMSRLSEMHPRMTPLTQCLGTLAYMPPKALKVPPVYSKKLDVFCADNGTQLP